MSDNAFPAAAYDEALRCVRCGFCLDACPTYRQLGVETASPRGRLNLVRAVAEGRLPLDDSFADPMHLCLGCRACETACPSGLQYGQVLAAARAAVAPHRRQPFWRRLGDGLAFRRLLPHPPRLRRLAGALRLAQSLGRGRRGAWLHAALPRRLRPLAAALPPAPTPALRQAWQHLGIPVGPGWRQVPARGRQRHRVVFFPGCVMDALYLSVNLATVEVLTAVGCSVLIPTQTTCCGALHAHEGRADEARNLARHNAGVLANPPVALGAIAATAVTDSPGDVDAIINNAGGCGAHLREYGHLLNGTDQAAAGRTVAECSLDISRWLATIGWGDARLGPVPLRVTYQDSCHLAHGQGVRREPRQLLAAIPELELVELAGADRCCGSAGIYNLTHPAMAAAVLDEKMQSVVAVGPQVVVTANPGCHLQLAAGCATLPAGQRPRVLHLVELLAASLRAQPHQ